MAMIKAELDEKEIRETKQCITLLWQGIKNLKQDIKKLEANKELEEKQKRFLIHVKESKINDILDDIELSRKQITNMSKIHDNADNYMDKATA